VVFLDYDEKTPFLPQKGPLYFPAHLKVSLTATPLRLGIIFPMESTFSSPGRPSPCPPYPDPQSWRTFLLTKKPSFFNSMKRSPFPSGSNLPPLLPFSTPFFYSREKAISSFGPTKVLPFFSFPAWEAGMDRAFPQREPAFPPLRRVPSFSSNHFGAFFFLSLPGALSFPTYPFY